jgi:cellulose synthase/poly-beta-1,6-N-acetylglucosamine synthase-like glycosyltransferase
MISFIVPAHNEQAGLGRTLQAIHDSARVVGQPYEIIVVDDASTDATAEVARQHHATVVPVNHRQIAATRNSGGRAARGDRLFFVDADTTINPRAVGAALRYMDNGAVGGGAAVWFDGVLPLYAHLMAMFMGIVSKIAGFTGGAFMFCTREAFHATGGFSERLYCGEEGSLALALKREGRFVVLWERVLTSGRRFRTMSGLQLLGNCARLALFPSKAVTQRSSVEKIWYDSNRERDDHMPSTAGVKVSNAIALLLTIFMVAAPLWAFVPWSLTPLATPVGKIRFVFRTFFAHGGLLIWPSVGVVLFVNLLRQKRWTSVIQSVALIALCLWFAWGALRGVIWTWTLFCHWLAHRFNG